MEEFYCFYQNKGFYSSKKLLTYTKYSGIIIVMGSVIYINYVYISFLFIFLLHSGEHAACFYRRIFDKY